MTRRASKIRVEMGVAAQTLAGGTWIRGEERKEREENHDDKTDTSTEGDIVVVAVYDDNEEREVKRVEMLFKREVQITDSAL